ncbi:FLYWCH zinc finger domain-containing protein [Phthorimaea operculella]|nr:FLYWCH zinc finger domain-containing protein [Phthorimaea operculella]
MLKWLEVTRRGHAGFYKNKCKGMVSTWLCNCSSSVRITNNQVPTFNINMFYIQDGTKRPTFLKMLSSTVTLVQNTAGKTLALYGGYTFYLHDVCRVTKGWPCTRPRCRARLTTTTDGVLLRATGHHDHEPPRYVIHRGIFTKI